MAKSEPWPDTVKNIKTMTQAKEERNFEKDERANTSRWKRIENLPGLGIGFIFLTVLLYQGMWVITKKMSLHPFVILFLRDVLLTPQYIAPIIYNKQTVLPKGKVWLLAVRSIIDGVHLIIHLFAVKALPLGDVTMMAAIRVVFTNLFSCIFLKEPCGVFEICNIFLVLGGIVCVVQPPIIFGGNSEYTDEMLVMAAIYLTSNAVAAICFIIARHLRELHWAVLGIHSRIFNLLELVVALVYTGTFCLPPCGLDRGYIVALAVLGSLGSATLVLALKYEKAGVIGLADNGGHLIASQVLGIIFFNEVPGVLKVVGVLLVLASIASLGVRGFLDARRIRTKELKMEGSDFR